MIIDLSFSVFSLFGFCCFPLPLSSGDWSHYFISPNTETLDYENYCFNDALNYSFLKILILLLPVFLFIIYLCIPLLWIMISLKIILPYNRFLAWLLVTYRRRLIDAFVAAIIVSISCRIWSISMKIL